MGGTAVRAVALCNPVLIEHINESFIAVRGDEFETENGAWTHLLGPEVAADSPARKLLNEIHARYQARDGRLLKLFVVTLDGRIHEGRGNLMDDDPLRTLSTELAHYVAPAYACPPPTVAAAASRPPTPTESDGENLRVVVRYTEPPREEALKLNNSPQVDALDSFVYMPAFAGPLRDWIVLPHSDIEKMLPPPSTPLGQAYVVENSVATRIMSHFCPESGPVYVKENIPLDVAMSGTVTGLSPSSVHVDLVAESHIANRGLSGMNAHSRPFTRLDVTARGFMEFNPLTGRIQDIQMASEHGADVGPGGALEFRAVAYRVSPTVSQGWGGR